MSRWSSRPLIWREFLLVITEKYYNRIRGSFEYGVFTERFRNKEELRRGGSTDEEKFLLAEYQFFTESFWKNEETGEKRVEFFITLATATIAGIVALITRSGDQLSDESVRNIASGALKEHRSRKTGRGQVHYWFLFKFAGEDEAITLGDKKEFRAWKWMLMSQLVAKVVDFKKPVYENLAQEFKSCFINV